MRLSPLASIGRITSQEPEVGQRSKGWHPTSLGALTGTTALAFLSDPGPGRDLPRTRSPSHSHPQRAAEVKEEKKIDSDKCRRATEHSATSKTEMEESDASD